ncbi:MAG: tetraacyldisaccharide 4'-kinase [Calditrichae bacterium]|nr:tetraacyldisaccharide 4'-kinase [Calditrichia bacterium]
MHRFFRYLLWPLSIKYGLMMEVRNYFYDRKFFKIHSYDIPVISIGNITAGGTGKTPFTIFLADYFLKQGKKVAVVSRGYGRKSKGFQLVSDGKDLVGNPMIHGDEPCLVAKRLPVTIVAVSEKRYIAIEYVIKNFNVDIILMDDGFQHRSVKRDIDIVLTKEWNNMSSKFVIPAGLLREFRFNIKRADIVINTDSMENNQSDFQARFFAEDICDFQFNKIGKLSDYSEKKAIAFSAIAKPDNFFNTLTDAKIDVIQKYIFKDHYYFTQDDLDNIISQCQKNGIDNLFCTEKDMVKIHLINGFEQKLKSLKIRILSPRLDVKFNDKKSFLENLHSILD